MGWGSSWHFYPKEVLILADSKAAITAGRKAEIPTHLKKVVDEIKRVEGGRVVRLGWVKALGNEAADERKWFGLSLPNTWNH